MRDKFCPICLEEVDDKSSASMPSSCECKAVYHKNCVDNFLKFHEHDTAKQKCPICRQEFNVVSSNELSWLSMILSGNFSPKFVF